MEQPLHTFAAKQSGDYTTFWISLIIAIASLGLAWYLLKRKGPRETYNQRMLISMLVFFVFLMATGTSFFSFWNMQRTGPIKIYIEKVETPYGIVSFEEIRNAYIESDKQRSFIDPSVVRREKKLLVIEEFSNKTHAMSEDNYEVYKILDSLKYAVRKWEETTKADF